MTDGAVVAGMDVEPLVHRVVELIENTALNHLDPAATLGLIALVLAGAGLVTLQNVALGGWDHLPLLVAEPFPRVDASIGVVLATEGDGEPLAQRLRRHVLHPSVDALVVVVTGPVPGLLPRELDGVPVRTAMLRRSPAAGSTV